MGEQEKKRSRAPTNYALFDATSDDGDEEHYNLAVMGGIWKELILAAKKLPDDFSDFTPPAKKKVKENGLKKSIYKEKNADKNDVSNNSLCNSSINDSISSSLSSSCENKKSYINDEKRKQKSSHRDREKERNSSKDRDKHKSSSGEKERNKISSNKDKEKDKLKNSNGEKERDKISINKDREKEKSKSSSEEKEKDKHSSSKDREGEKHKSSSKDKERDKRSSIKDKEREKNKNSSIEKESDKSSSSKDRVNEKHKSSSKDKERDKRSTSKDKEREKHKSSSMDKERDKRSRSKDKENEKEESEKSKGNCDVDSDKISKTEEIINNEKKDTIKNSSEDGSQDGSQDRSQDRNDKIQVVDNNDKIKGRRNDMDESVDKGNSIEINSKNKDNSIIEVCYDDMKFNMASEESKGEKLVVSIPVSIGPLTSTQKTTPERRKPKERLSVEEKVFQRELEAALAISKLEVTADSETLKMEENEVNCAESEKSIDLEVKCINEVKSEELKVPKLILKVKPDQHVSESFQKDEINKDNKKDCEIKTCLKEDVPVYEIKKDENCDHFKAGNENLENSKVDETKLDSSNINKIENNLDTHSFENIVPSSKSKPGGEDTKINSDKIYSEYENPQPSTSTGFISGKRQRKTVVFKEESDSDDCEFSVQSDSEESNFEISPLKKSKKGSKTSNSKTDKKAANNIKAKGNKNNNGNETPKLEKQNTNRISPRSRGNRKSVIDDDSDSNPDKKAKIIQTKGNKSNNIKETPKPEKENTNIISPRSRGNRKPITVDGDFVMEEFKKSTIGTLVSTKKENNGSSDAKDDMKENDPLNVNSPKIDKNKSPQVKRTRKPTKIYSDSDESDEDFDCDSDNSEFKPSPKKKLKSTSKEKQTKPVIEKKASSEISKKLQNKINLPSNAGKANIVLKTTSGTSPKSSEKNKPVITTPTRNIGMLKPVASANSSILGITKPGLSPTHARVSTGLVKTPFRSPLLNMSSTTSSSVPRSTTPDVRSIGLRIGLSRKTAFKPLHPNLSRNK